MSDRHYCHGCERFVGGGIDHRSSCPTSPEGDYDNAADALADLTGHPRSEFEHEGEVPELTSLEEIDES